MHADEVATDVSLVRRLLAAQFPKWAGLPETRDVFRAALPVDDATWARGRG